MSTNSSIEMEPLRGPHVTAAFVRIPVQTLYQCRMGSEGPSAFKAGKQLRYEPAEARCWVRLGRPECG